MGKRKFKGHVPGQKQPQAANDRFPCGKLRAKPPEPNARVLAARSVLGLPENSTVGPLAFAYRRGWIRQFELITAESYADAYRNAAVGAPGVSIPKDDGFAYGAAAELKREWHAMTDAQVIALKWTELTRAEIAAIWDSAMRPIYMGEGRGGGSMRRWRIMAGAVTRQEREQINRVALFDCWPAWILERHAGQVTPGAEKERALLLSGLGKMDTAWRAARAAQPANDHHGNDNDD